MPPKPTPPMLSGPPLIGHALAFQRDRTALIQRGLREVGPLFGLRLGPKRAAVVLGPEHHEVFFAETDKALSIEQGYAFLKPLFGATTLAAPPEVYERQRPVFHAPFRGGKTEHFLAVMQEEVQAWLDTWGEAGELELTEPITQLTQRVAAHALMGRELLGQLGEAFWADYGVIARSLNPVIPASWPLPMFRARDRARDRMREVITPIIAQRRRERGHHEDFLQEFVDARYADGEVVEDELILNLILGLMFAGHETTAGQAAWSLVDLAQDPAHTARVQAEVDAALPRGEALTGARLRQLKQVRAAVLESGRLHPSADILPRVAVEDVEMGEHRIPAGWMVFAAPAVTHRLPEHFPEPERYDPLRFQAGDERARRHRLALIGFGGGHHKCTGMNFANWEMAVILALVHQQYEVELAGAPPVTVVGVGASRPSEARLRYRRRAEA